MSVSLSAVPQIQGPTAAWQWVAFTTICRDVFSPHLLEFQRKIVDLYRDLPMAGASKDEWGFPPCFDGNPGHDDYWYSPATARAYAEHTGGRDLLRDCVLMAYGETGREADRILAVNHFFEMCRQRGRRHGEDFLRRGELSRLGRPLHPSSQRTHLVAFPRAVSSRRTGWPGGRSAATGGGADEFTPPRRAHRLAKKVEQPRLVQQVLLHPPGST